MVGDILVSGYLMPDGSRKLSKSDAVTLIGCDKRRLSQLLEKKVAQTLLPQGLGVVPTPTETGKIDAISIPDFCTLCVIALTSGYEKAIAFAGASMVEVIERRFDEAVGVVRTEEERNQRFVVRRDGIISRHFWTDCIDQYCKTNEVSDNYKKWVYIHVSDYLNKALFGKTSKEIRDHYDIGDRSPRDYFPAETLKIVDTIEKATALRVSQTGSEPKQALKDVVALLGVEQLPL